MGERIRRVKMRKLVGCDKDSLIGKAKAAHVSKAKQGIHSPLPMELNHDKYKPRVPQVRGCSFTRLSSQASQNVAFSLLPNAVQVPSHPKQLCLHLQNVPHSSMFLAAPHREVTHMNLTLSKTQSHLQRRVHPAFSSSKTKHLRICNNE